MQTVLISWRTLGASEVLLLSFPFPTFFFLVCFLPQLFLKSPSPSSSISANRLYLLSPPLTVWTLDLLSSLRSGPGRTLRGPLILMNMKGGVGGALGGGVRAVILVTRLGIST